MGINGTDIGLVDLLHWSAGLLDPAAASHVERAVQRHTELGMRWRVLRLALDHADQFPRAPHETVGRHHATEGDEFTAEEIGAWLEGRLDRATADALEQACWRSPDLLQEVIGTFQLLRQPPDPGDRQRQKRLAELVDWEAVPATPRRERGGRRRAGHATRRSPFLPVAIGLAVAAASIAGALIVWRVGQRNAGPPHPTDRTMADSSHASSDDRDRGATPAPAPHRQSPGAPVDSDRPPSRPTLPAGSGGEHPGPRKPSRPDHTPTEAPHGPSLDPHRRPDPHGEPTPGGSPRAPVPKVTWQQVAGLLVRRHGSHWSGIAARGAASYSESSPKQSTERFQTLSGSWARGDWPTVGELFVAADSRFELGIIQPTSATPSPHLRVDRGRVAVRMTRMSQPLRVESHGTAWQVASVGEAADVVVESSPAIQRLVVLRGRIAANGTTLKRRQALTGAHEVTTLRDVRPLAIFQRPGDAVRLPTDTARQLAGSSDLVGDLRRLVDASRSPSVLAPWLLTLEEGHSLPGLLAHSNALVRTAAVEWLLRERLPPEAQRVVFGRLARAVGDRAAVRQLHKWVEQWQAGKTPSAKELVAMSHMLQHDHLAVRHASAWILSRYIGPLPGYDPAAAERRRRAAADRIRSRLVHQLRRAADKGKQGKPNKRPVDRR